MVDEVLSWKCEFDELTHAHSCACTRRYEVTFIVLWLWTATDFAVYLSSVVNLLYDPERLAFLHSGNEPYFSIARTVEFYVSVSETLLTLAAYVGILGCIWHSAWKQRVKPNSNSAWTVSNRRRDLSILLQAFLISGCALANVIYWNVYRFIYHDSLIASYISTLMWIINCGINPAIYLILSNDNRLILAFTCIVLWGLRRKAEGYSWIFVGTMVLEKNEERKRKI
ncbi:unnamed protein product [Toxocara canis]|uniref:7TM_GPCR_Srx domain-containing protein n=1 Tax=Toxocara canis TaxID=6265 RepID=A0A183V5R5_TOXCA|nr:unnamed protein product [Toxocara canis]